MSSPHEPERGHTESVPYATPVSFDHLAGYESSYAATATDAYFWELFRRGEIIATARVSFRAQTPGGNTVDTLVGAIPPFEIARHVGMRGTDSSVLVRSVPGDPDPFWATFDLYTENISGVVGAGSLARCREITAALDKARSTPVIENTVAFQVFTENEQWGNWRKFNKCDWESISENYPVRTRDGLDRLTKMRHEDLNDASGRIILFYGRPGTGKTWAIRALLTEWSEWAEGVIVADAEALFGNPGYMLTVLGDTRKKSLRIVILEDADDVVRRHDARGPGVARLLNMTDGMMSAGQNTLVLLTTNAPPDALDQALTRPGRCIAAIGFEPFSAAEATERMGGTDRAGGPLTLAEIYERMGVVTMIETEMTSPSGGQYL